MFDGKLPLRWRAGTERMLEACDDAAAQSGSALRRYTEREKSRYVISQRSARSLHHCGVGCQGHPQFRSDRFDAAESGRGDANDRQLVVPACR